MVNRLNEYRSSMKKNFGLHATTTKNRNIKFKIGDVITDGKHKMEISDIKLQNDGSVTYIGEKLTKSGKPYKKNSAYSISEKSASAT